MTPWEFYSTPTAREFTDFALAQGAHTPTPTTAPTVFVDEDRITQYICNNADDAMVRYYEPRPYMSSAENYEMALPGTLGMGAGCSTEYSWGLKNNSAEATKQLIGEKAFAQLGVASNTAFVKLIVFMPGHGIPWHRDSFTGWKQVVGSAESALVRKVLMLTPWHWGHFLQVDNTAYTGWSAGTAYDILPGVWHLSHNHGTIPHVMASITGERT